jgi:PTH1 family peptidyl-tRNA hydrolase
MMSDNKLQNGEDIFSFDKNWLIVGLGNPGEKYEKTRHNLGFMLIDLLASQFQIQIKREECRSLIGQTIFENQTLEFVKPQTFMNLSGEAISCLVKKESRDSKKIIVIVDDLALPLGTIRIRSKGSDGGHNGLKSTIACLKTKEFIRIRIGIQPDHPLSNTSKFVLENFSKKDFETVDSVLERSADAVRCLISEGINKTMSQFNG